VKLLRKKFVIPLLFIFVPILLFMVFFADAALKKVVEAGGSAIVGAKVELGGADLAINLSGASLKGLEVTDPDEPMRNALVAKEISFDMDSSKLLRRKVIINELKAEGIELGTERKLSGALEGTKKAEKKKKEDKGEQGFAGKVFNAGEIISTEKKEIEKSITNLTGEIKKEQKRLEGEIKNLPGEEKLSEYKTKIDEIKKTERDPFKVLSAAKDLKKLKKEIKKDVDKYDSVKGDIKKSTSEYEKKVKELKEKEIERLLAKYSPTGAVANLAEKMFSPMVGEYVDKALMWRSKLTSDDEGVSKEEKKPVRAKGVDVVFREKNPLPDFLLRTAGLSLKTERGMVTGTVIDITNDQTMYGRPTRFEFSGTTLKGIESLSVKGLINHIDKAKTNDELIVELSGFEFNDFDLGSFKLSGWADITADSVVRNGKFESIIKMNFKGAEIEMPDNKNNKDDKISALAKGLSAIHEFEIKARVSGVPDDYEIKISSDLDDVAKKVFKGAAEDKTKEMEAELRRELDKQMEEQFKSLGAGLGGFGSLGDTVEGKSDKIEKLLR